ncbi:MAG: response regulator [Candidatus Omnitrophota bacterium]|jgi:CheY-like chemotaxis protein
MKKILIIDDEEDFCFFLQQNLEAAGNFKVVSSSNGQEGLEMAEKMLPDLILLDIMMPGMDGSDVAAELKNDPRTRDIPVIFLTAIIKEGEIKAAKGFIAGWHYIAKPVEMAKLLTMIDTLTLNK